MAALHNLFADIRVLPEASCVACAPLGQLTDVQRLNSLAIS